MFRKTKKSFPSLIRKLLNQQNWMAIKIQEIERGDLLKCKKAWHW